MSGRRGNRAGSRYRRITVDPSDTATIRMLVAEAMESPSVDATRVFDRLERKYRAMAEARKGEAKPR